mgnify:CR=1 FL=1
MRGYGERAVRRFEGGRHHRCSQLFEGGREWAILRDGVMGAPAEDRTIMLNALRGLTRAFSDVTAERNSARRDAQRKAKAE